MTRTSVRRIAAACLGAALIASGPAPRRALADRPTPTASLPTPGLTPIEPRGASRRATAGGTAGGWWLGAAGIALALAAFGAISLASRRLPARGVTGGRLEVIGRASLSARHTVHLVRAGDRVLIIGTGAQGAPALLGGWDEPAEARGGGGA